MRIIRVIAVAAMLLCVHAGDSLGSSARTGAIPVNPCKLKLAAQLKALRVSLSCTPVASTNALGKVYAGTWGTRPHVLGIGFWAFGSPAKMALFKKSFSTLGNVKRVGPNAVEAIIELGVSYAGILKGIGVQLSVNEPTAGAATKSADARKVLTLVNAISSQI